MKNVSDKSRRENRKNISYQITFFVCFFFGFFFYFAVDEITWKNVVERGRPQMTTWLMRIACCITTATNSHSECLILIAFSL